MENGQVTPTEPQVVETPVVDTAAQEAQAAFEQQMAYQFMAEPPAPAAEPELPANPDASAEPTPPAPELPKEPNYLAELGFADLEDAKAKIAEWQKIKDTPQTPQEIQFANEESKKVHQLLKEGKVQEVISYYSAKETLANIDTMGQEEKLKLYIKMQNPKFDQELIDDEYRELYSIDEDDPDFIDPMKLRKEKMRLAQRLENDTQKAQEYFSQYLQKVELPDITPATAVIDKDYEAWKASSAETSEYEQKVVAPAIAAITEDSMKMAFEVNDANNQMNFGVSFTPVKEDLEVAKKDAANMIDFLTQVAYDKDQKLRPTEMAKMTYLYKNFDKLAQSLMRQAVNAERKRVVETEKGSSGVQRTPVTEVVKSEFQKQMEYAFQ
jgi:hypothetical protein